jgi:hypothetical protein
MLQLTGAVMKHPVAMAVLGGAGVLGTQALYSAVRNKMNPYHQSVSFDNLGRGDNRPLRHDSHHLANLEYMEKNDPLLFEFYNNLEPIDRVELLNYRF